MISEKPHICIYERTRFQGDGNLEHPVCNDSSVNCKSFYHDLRKYETIRMQL